MKKMATVLASGLLAAGISASANAGLWVNQGGSFHINSDFSSSGTYRIEESSGPFGAVLIVKAQLESAFGGASSECFVDPADTYTYERIKNLMDIGFSNSAGLSNIERFSLQQKEISEFPGLEIFCEITYDYVFETEITPN